MTVEQFFDFTPVESQLKEKKCSNFNENVDNGEESSTESTFYGEDCKAIDVFFDDDSSMCSSSSEESMTSCEYGTFTRTFGDEDSLVLAKGRQQQEPETPVPPVFSSRADDILLQAEFILEGLTISVPKPEIIFKSGSTFRQLLNRRARTVGADALIDLHTKGRPIMTTPSARATSSTDSYHLL